MIDLIFGRSPCCIRPRRRRAAFVTGSPFRMSGALPCGRSSDAFVPDSAGGFFLAAPRNLPVPLPRLLFPAFARPEVVRRALPVLFFAVFLAGFFFAPAFLAGFFFAPVFLDGLALAGPLRAVFFLVVFFFTLFASRSE